MDRWCTRAVSPELTWSSVRTGAQHGAPVGVAWHPAPQYAGYAAWRVVTPAVPVGASCESWGAGERFGYAPLPDGRVYCYAAANAPKAPATAGWPGCAAGSAAGTTRSPALPDAADPGAVLHHDLYELPPLRMFTCGNVVAAGDAAHAMTPGLGQGAC
jgi:2-polyprenyl-6-methoxyphenol hydroxylase-like FAD-dependent oxidoreductase